MLNHMMIFFILLNSFFMTSCSANSDDVHKEKGIIIYYKNDFDKSKKGFHGSRKVSQKLVDDSISGKALLSICKKKWAGPMLDLDIKGSKNLKIAFMAKGENFKVATLNMFDKKANDNTTPYGYRFLPDDTWVPVLYYVDLFRYNSKNSGHIRNDTHFTNIRFWGPEPKDQDVKIILDNFVVYRGDDRAAPSKIQGLHAEANKDGVMLKWKVPYDNAYPMVYVISRSHYGEKFKKIAETYHPYYFDRTVEGGTYKYRVLACDFQNNIGEWSTEVEIKGKFKSIKSEPNILIKDRMNYGLHIIEVHERGMGKVDKGLVVMYGDSLTGPTLYPRFVAGALGIYRVRAYGYAGMGSGWGKRNLDKKVLNKVKPEFMLLMFGTNDVRGKVREKKVYMEWVDNVIATAKKAESEGVVVIIGTIPPRGFKDPLSFPEASFNKLLIEEARKNKIPVAYVFKEIQNSGDRHKFIWKDGVHWTSKGMEVAARAWAKTFKQVEFVLRDRP